MSQRPHGDSRAAAASALCPQGGSQLSGSLLARLRTLTSCVSSSPRSACGEAEDYSEVLPRAGWAQGSPGRVWPWLRVVTDVQFCPLSVVAAGYSRGTSRWHRDRARRGAQALTASYRPSAGLLPRVGHSRWRRSADRRQVFSGLDRYCPRSQMRTTVSLKNQ